MRVARTLIAAALALALATAAASPAQAAFGLNGLEVSSSAKDGSPAVGAGSHPNALSFHIATNTTVDPRTGRTIPEEEAKNLVVSFPPGFAGNPTAVPRCTSSQFLAGSLGECPNATAIGIALIEYGEPGTTARVPVYNLVPSPGKAAKIGFIVEARARVTVDIGVNPDPPYNVISTTANISQALSFLSADLTVWGVPAAESHDSERGTCLGSKSKCEVSIPETPFLTLPTSCAEPLRFGFSAVSWQNPGAVPFEDSAAVQNGLAPPSDLSPTGCASLRFAPRAAAQPTSTSAQSPSGLDVNVDVNDEGIGNPEGSANSAIKKAVLTLPEGVTINPSQAEGLGVCSEAQLARERPDSAPGEGCPQASKIGTVEAESPLLEGTVLTGSLFVATPYENPAGTLIALYMVIKDPELGILLRLPGKVEPDLDTGRLIGTFDELPQLPVSHFHLHFREGGRSPLVTPAACGTYTTEAQFTPWSRPFAPYETTSTFQITSGPEGQPCPSGGVPPFHPGLIAGTLNNAAGKYSPFNLRLFRSDSEQEFTNFSIKLPPGLVGKLAGIPFCSDAAIAAATARTGPHGGQEELDSPSCPAASEVGHTLAGAGVGPELTYAPGKVYLAGPYHGSALSLVSITAGVVGPFDIGTVVVRFALKINPETAEVFIDATGSDPIPHIIQGIPVHLRDIRTYVDRPSFVLNPTSCAKTSTASTVLGSGLDFASEADDQPITVTSPFQAADCASLGFAPKLALSLKGGTKRGDTPAFKATLTYPKGYYANIKSAQVTLPHSEFLEQAHIKTICTRVQFAAGAGNGAECPAASIYGKAKAVTPILSEPLEGPVYLRSSSHNLPDLVAALHNGEIDIDLDGHIDSVKGGRIRNTFEAVPDAPVTSFTLEMQSGKKGLLVNSTNLCGKANKAIAAFTGQNGKVHNFNPVLQAQCPKGRKKHKAKGTSKRLALTSPW
jgi:hypothetical protein